MKKIKLETKKMNIENPEYIYIGDRKVNLEKYIKEHEELKIKANKALITRDEEKRPVELLSCNEAISILKEGKFVIRPGAGPSEKWGANWV